MQIENTSQEVFVLVQLLALYAWLGTITFAILKVNYRMAFIATMLSLALIPLSFAAKTSLFAQLVAVLPYKPSVQVVIGLMSIMLFFVSFFIAFAIREYEKSRDVTA